MRRRPKDFQHFEYFKHVNLASWTSAGQVRRLPSQAFQSQKLEMSSTLDLSWPGEEEEEALGF